MIIISDFFFIWMYTVVSVSLVIAIFIVLEVKYDVCVQFCVSVTLSLIRL